MAGLVGIFVVTPRAADRTVLADLARPMLHNERLSLHRAADQSAWMSGVVAVKGGRPLVYELSSGATAVVSGIVVDANGSTTAAILEQGLAALRMSVPELARWINGLDGSFALSLHDPQVSKGLLVNDHYGGVPVYMGWRGRDLVWASEVKAIHAMVGGKPDVDALGHFLEHGYVGASRTYYQGITQLGRNQFVLADLARLQSDIHEIHEFLPLPTMEQREISYEAAKSEFKELLADAVRRRVAQAGMDEVTVTLSGGLDSRILAAEAHRQGLRVIALTYGQAASPEMRIAKRVAEGLGIDHTVVPVTGHNWLNGRADAVWMSDGMMDFMHTHIVHLADHLPSGGLVLDGLFGDVVLGRGRITLDPALSDDENRYLRVNRFTYFGPRIESNYSVVASPLIDKGLVRFMDSLNPAFTENSRLYVDAAAELHRALFTKVPWHKTGVPPAPFRDRAVRLKWQKLQKRLNQGLRWLGVPLAQSYFTMDYFGWMQDANFKAMTKDLVYGEGGQLKRLLALPTSNQLFSRYPNAARAKLSTRLLTLELWLRRSNPDQAKRNEA